MKMRVIAMAAGLAVAATGVTSCGNSNSTGPVREAVSNKDAYQQAYPYALPMIAAYKAMYELNVDKTSSQFKSPLNVIANEARAFTYKDTSIVTPNSDTPRCS